ncbi:translation initiation factor IF-2 [Kitasatospora sp. NPDC056327]|uniref:translation initiation factor IF-2 n=1 Tax=Kitasatospora sp. NPDC056327 TaxID=3345785 RepID=UPI0035D55494
MTTDQHRPVHTADPAPTTCADRPDARSVPAGYRPGRGEGWFFLSEALRAFRLTGAVAPSGADLVNALVVPATSRPDRPISVLEVGAGTGAVTRRLARALRPGDRLHVVESNPRFVQRLRADPELASRAAQLGLRVSECRVQDLPGPCTTGPDGGETVRGHEGHDGHEGHEGDGGHGADGESGGRTGPGTGPAAGPAPGRYDVIVSGLPFTNFDPAEVRDLLDLYLRLLVPGGELTYFGYLGTSAARLLTSGPGRSSRHRAVVRLLRRFEEEYGLGHRTAWWNLPPARAHLLRAPGGERRW